MKFLLGLLGVKSPTDKYRKFLSYRVGLRLFELKRRRRNG